MMKRFIYAALLACVTLTASADETDNSMYTLQSGDAIMSIDISKGGKILSLKYKDQEIISQSRFPESFGSTFWTSPQKEWNWPPVQEFDKQAYTVKRRDSHLVISSPVSERLGLSVGKDFSVDSKDGAFVITYSIKNEGSAPRRVAPWEITRVANSDGTIFFEAVDSIWPAGLMSFKKTQGVAWYKTDEGPQNRKVNADGSGWLAYSANGLLLVKTFQDLKAEEPAPGEAEIQVYVNRGKTYIELESQGAYTLLEPGAELHWTVRWYLTPNDKGTAETVQGLLKNYSSKKKVDPIVVRTESGLVEGIDQEGSIAFLGIPYAKVERFMPPQPVKKWKGVRVCDHWGPQAMQQTNRPMTEEQMSEQCCVLNVWTTSPLTSPHSPLPTLKPVMVWLHGGGFDSGTSEWDPGMCLAQKDVVVVGVNHRLNILGFLDLSTCGKKYKYSGNVGMLDVVQALQWVQKNIRQFGGDPSNVTIFGESGGGGKVGTLLCMPPARGLFHKAIIMSGTILNVNTKAMTEELGEAVLKELGINKKHVDKIKDVPYKDLYAAGQRAMAASIGTRRPGTPMMWGFGPTPDGEVLIKQPFQPDFCDFNDNVPILIGTTFNELQRSRYGQKMTLEQARQELQRTFDNETDAYISAFCEAYPQKSLGQLPADLLCIDWLFRPKTIITADAIGGKRKADTYAYMYTVGESDNRGYKGSAHGSELKYCFDVLHHYTKQLSASCIEHNKRWAETLSNVWTRFAYNGNPNCDGLPDWHPYTQENGELLEFGGDKPSLHHNHDRKLEEIIDRHCFKQLDEFRKTHK